MSREEAKRILYVYRAVNLVDASHREAFDKAIEALEQEPCDDAISRQAVLDMLGQIKEKDLAISLALEMCIRMLPPVKPAEKVGQWIPVSEIENIKSEINELSELDHIEPTYEDCKRDVLKILDKYKASPTGAERRNESEKI